MSDLRPKILEAGLATLRKHGYAGFTQPRVAGLAGMRQSHLTYYYPTRLDLLAAVGRAAVDQQLVAVNATVSSLQSIDQAALAIANLVSRRDDTRVLLALAQAGDEEPKLRELFQELANAIVAQVGRFIERTGHVAKGIESARAIHAISVGLAVVDLATGLPSGKERAADIMRLVLTAVLGGAAAKTKPMVAPKQSPRTKRAGPRRVP